MVQISSSYPSFEKPDDGVQKAEQQKNNRYKVLNPQAVENRISNCFTTVCDGDCDASRCDCDCDCDRPGCDCDCEWQ